MNKSPKTLLFVTYQYPYLPGEYFIEEEIKYLSKAFKKLLVVPARCFWWTASGEAREMPENVELVDPRLFPLYLRVYWSVWAMIVAFIVHLKGHATWPGSPAVEKVSFIPGLKSTYKTCVAKCFLGYAIKNHVAGELVAYSYWRNFAAASLGLLKKHQCLSRLYVRCHRVDIYHPNRWPNQSIIQNFADAVFPVSQDGFVHLTRDKGLNSDAIEVQRLGVGIPENSGLGSDDGVLRILSCSNIVPVKRVDLIAKMVRELPGKIEWIHIGEGSDKDDVLEVCKTFDENHRFNFLGRLANAEVLKYYENNPIDLFVNLSESEGVPVSIMEALSYGIPVLATDVGGTGEIVGENNGLLVTVDTPVDLIIQKTAKLLQSDTFNCLRANARETAEEICSSERNYRKFCERIQK